MRVCPICGEHFDERLYQVLVSGLDQAFDSVDCAERALASIGRETSSTVAASLTEEPVSPELALVSQREMVNRDEGPGQAALGAGSQLLDDLTPGRRADGSPPA